MEQFIFEERSLLLGKDGKGLVFIEGEEHFHLARVLRVKVGEKILATNGSGTTCLCLVTKIEKEKSVCGVLEEYRNLNASLRKFCIGIALLKPMSKVEMAIEKCTELGASRFVLFGSERSENMNPRIERLNGIIKSAVKQSLQCRFPELMVAKGLEEVVSENADFDEKIVLHERSNRMFEVEVSLQARDNSAIALIGPEGGFSENEIMFLSGKGYNSLSLGKARLRSETAAIKAASLLAAY